jgi:TfoX/Sxy family transcriptional regulator of competence genes
MEIWRKSRPRLASLGPTCSNSDMLRVVAYDLHLADRIRPILKSACKFSERKMFGGLAFMVNDRMCCGVLKSDLVLRLTPKEAAACLRLPHTRPMDFTGRPMKSMIYVDASGTDSDEALAAWVEISLRASRTAPDTGAARSGKVPRATWSALSTRRSANPKSASKRDAR